MTKEEWAKVEIEIEKLYGMVRLLVDGREITIKRVLVSKKNQLAIGTYVDGEILGEWFSAEFSGQAPPELRFMREKKRLIHKREIRKALKSKLHIAQKFGIDPDAAITYHVPYWNNVTQIRRHYTKTFTNIELLSCGGRP